MNEPTPTLQTRMLKTIKEKILDPFFFTHQDRISTYLYYMQFQLFNQKFMSTIEYMYTTGKWAKTLPRGKFDIVIGLPRVGMIAAYLVGIELGIPVSTIDSFETKQFYTPMMLKDKISKKFNRILIVDETIGSGNSIEKVRRMLLKLNPRAKIYTAVTTTNERKVKDVDYYCMLDKDNRTFFEFDLVDTQPKQVHCLCTDLDGVLCEDMPQGTKEKDYAEHYKSVKPNKIPIFKIRTIVTGRLEKYRRITEEWLTKNNVRYERLVMTPEGSDPVTVKAKIVREDKLGWFWESDPIQSEKLFLLTGCRVLCFENMYLYGGMS